MAHTGGVVKRGHAVERDLGVDSNARMTALLGVCLLGLTVGAASLGWTSAWRKRPRNRDGFTPATALLVAR